MSSESSRFRDMSSQGSATGYRDANGYYCTTSVDRLQSSYPTSVVDYLNEPYTFTERLAAGLPPDPRREGMQEFVNNLGDTITPKKSQRSTKPRDKAKDNTEYRTR